MLLYLSSMDSEPWPEDTIRLLLLGCYYIERNDLNLADVD